MTNFYQILGVDAQASEAAIKEAHDKLYEKWRKLVDHHDPGIASQASASLQQLDIIRSTLLDRSLRAAYDQSINADDIISGLGDPEAVYTPPPSPSRPATPPPVYVQKSTADSSAWQCPSCSTQNAAGTRFCISCGEKLGQDCPNCNRFLARQITYCPNCGIDINAAAAELVLKQEEAERQRVLRQRAEAERQALLAPMAGAANSAWQATKWGCILSFIPGVAVVSWILWLVGIVRGRKVLAMQRIDGDQPHRDTARSAVRWATVPLIILGGAILIYGCLFVFLALGSAGSL